MWGKLKKARLKSGLLDRAGEPVASLRAELQRSVSKLRAPGHPEPYYLSYLLRDRRSLQIWARYGAVGQQNAKHTRSCFADVRVGSHLYDQVSQGGLEDNSVESESYDMIDVPIENDPDSIRFSLWRLTDARYREAVADFYSRKSRDLSFVDPSRKIPSFMRGGSGEDIGSLQEYFFDASEISKPLRSLSMVFKKYPEIKNAYVEFSASLQTKYFVNSEGVLRVWQEPLFQLVAHFWFLGKDHHDQTINITELARDPEYLIEPHEFRARIEQKIAECYAVHAGRSMTSYAGPVLLGPRAAGLFLHEAIGHRLESSRFLSDDEGRLFADKLGKQVMPAEVDMFDDPTLTHWHGQSLIGAYPFDDEGTPSSRASLVKNGRLVGFLTTRSPYRRQSGSRRQTHQSNGHARSQNHERPMSRMGNLIITSTSSLDFSALKKKLLAEVRSRKLPFGVILYDVEGGETGTDAYDFQAFLGEITHASLIYPDGREEKIRGVDFVGTPLACLSQILAVGSEAVVDNGFCGAESGLIPVSTVAPAMIVSNLELQAKDPTKVTQYILPMPWLEESKSKKRTRVPIKRNARK